MKSLYLRAMIACTLFATNAVCQSAPPLNQRSISKPALFSQLPEKIRCSSASLQNVFDFPVNASVNATIGPSFIIQGTVLARVAISAEQLSVNIRCSNYDDALLNISRLTEKDGSLSYVGRMVSPRHGDVLLLWQENGQYSFIRQQQLLTMVE